ncbi:MAG TPA: zinc-ribbon domain-containing protein [Terriglobia bacterium]|nr:zinc-ribbon domain-containing protein [Terriglobia bacterium]
MAFCAKCGTQMNEGAAFCGSCGTPVAAAAGAPAAAPRPVQAAPPPAAYPPAAYPPAAPVAGAGTAGMTSNTSAMLTYIPFIGWIIGIVFAVTEPYKSDRFVRFHAFQSIFFAIACFVVSFALAIVSMVFTAIFLTSNFSAGFSMFGLLAGIFWIIRLAMLGGWLFLMFKAYNNERFMLPVIGPMAAQQAAK